MLTAEQKTRQILTGNPEGVVNFQHEGPDVVRWLSGGGLLPDAWVTFHPQGDVIEVRCAGCGNIVGHLPADHFDKEETSRQIDAIRQAGHEGHKPTSHP